MRRLAPAVLIALLPAGQAYADTLFTVTPTHLADLLRQPVAILVDANHESASCVDKDVVETRGKAVMSRYKIARAGEWGIKHPTAIYITVVGGETSTRSGERIGCIAAVTVELLSFTSGDGFLQWATNLGVRMGPGTQTSEIADVVQEFIEALVAKAAD